MSLRSIKQVKNLKNKRVLVRADMNVASENKKITDDFKIRASLPTLQFLIKQKARVVVMFHYGRPGGKKVSEYKVAPVAKRLGKLLDKKIKVLPRLTGVAVEKQIEGMEGGEIVMLENVRFHPDEKGNKGTLGKELAGLADIFILDGFGSSHRDDASVTGPTPYIPSYAGLLLVEELKGLDRVVKKTKKPFVVVIGGAKTETKIPVIKNLLPKAEHILISGGLLNTYLKAAKYKVGSSIIDDKFKKEMLAYGKKKRVILPVDVMVGDLDGIKYRLVDIKKKPHQICKKGEYILDIGPRSIMLFSKYIKSAQTLLWNGAIGYFEQKPYDIGTMAIARLVASRSKGKAFGVIGGGETVQTMDMVGMSDDIDLISTGGGAMLEYLAGVELPGIAALKSSSKAKKK